VKVIYSGSFHYKIGRLASKEAAFLCDLDIIEYENGVMCVVLTERTDNTALSISNVSDRIASQIYADYLAGVPENKVVWLEYYPPSRGNKAYIDLVQFDYEVVPTTGTGPGTTGTLRFYHPRWHRLYESRTLDRNQFMSSHANLIQNLYHAQVILDLDDREGHVWRIITGQEKLYVISPNSDAGLPDKGFDVPGMNALLREKKRFFSPEIDLEQRFTDELVKGFLNKGL